MTRILEKFARLPADSGAATAIEYGLILALIGIACIGAFNAFADGLVGMWNYISDTTSAVMG